MMTNTKLAAVAATLFAFATPALAGTGGSNSKIVAAVQTTSTDAIIAEVERAEYLMCPDCVQTVTNLTEDSRYAVREVAAWWFAKRPNLTKIMAAQMKDDLAGADSLHVRNAADFLGVVKQYDALPNLRTAMTRSGLSVEARFAIVHGVGRMAHVSGNSILQTGMGDSDWSVRAEAVRAWRDVLDQKDVTPVEFLLNDSEARVRAEAAATVGAYADQKARTALERLVTSDTDPFVRRNAAWALGQIGQEASRQALTQASADKSGLVKLVAKAALSSLK